MNKIFKFIRFWVKLILLLGVCTASGLLYGQNNFNNFILNPQPRHFLMNKGQFMASSYDVDRSLITLQYQNKIGIFSDIRNIYVDGILKSKQGHMFGMKVYSEQETSLYSKTKVFLMYGYTIHINDNLTWTSAAQVGAVNIVFGSSASSVGGSAWNWDASLSTTFKSKTWEFALALNQIPAAKLRPINYEFYLNRYVETYLSKKINVSPLIEWEVGVKALLNSDTSMFTLDNKISYRKNMGVLLMANTFKQVSLGGYFDVINHVGDFRLLFNYGFSVSNTYTNQSLYCIALYFKR